MTGIRISEPRPWRLLLLASFLPAGLHADNLTLEGDARLTGSVRSISDQGVVELTTPLSPEPVLLKPGAVSKVEFTAPDTAKNPPSTLLELGNGDILPVTIGTLDEENLHVRTADAGHLTIPRTALKSMQLGVRKRKSIYSGPNSLEEWSSIGNGPKGWQYSNGALVANGPAYIAKSFELPERFILKFTLKWQANPGFQLYFADPLKPKLDQADRYYLQFNSAGLEIKRESAEGKRFQTVMLLPRTPDQYPDGTLDFEIRVDRRTSRIYLLLNGEPEGAGFDHVAGAPSGNGISLVNSAPAGSGQEIRGIEILEFDNARARHRSEDRGDPTVDSLISRDEDRWGGHLTRIREGTDGTVFIFKSDFQEEPLELSESDVSTIFFAKDDDASDPAAAPENPFVLRLRSEGLLRVTSCSFTEDKVIARHPLLGPLEIDRAGVSALERVAPKPEAKPKP